MLKPRGSDAPRWPHCRGAVGAAGYCADQGCCVFCCAVLLPRLVAADDETRLPTGLLLPGSVASILLRRMRRRILEHPPRLETRHRQGLYHEVGARTDSGRDVLLKSGVRFWRSVSSLTGIRTSSAPSSRASMAPRPSEGGLLLGEKKIPLFFSEATTAGSPAFAGSWS